MYQYVPVPVPGVSLPESGTQRVVSGDPNLISSADTLLKANVPGVQQEPLLEISPPSRLMTMSRWGGGSDIT